MLKAVDNHVQAVLHQDIHNLSRGQVHRKAHLRKEIVVVENAAAVLADHIDKMKMERME
jgi:hypothetical protein